MPGAIPAVPGAKVVRALERAEFTVTRVSGSHHVMRHPGDQHWREALDAYLRFGRGRHKARLNFGDCLTYAVARLANEPLLFVGDDFPETDLELA